MHGQQNIKTLHPCQKYGFVNYANAVAASGGVLPRWRVYAGN